MTTVRELQALLSNLDQDAEVFIAVPKRDHWETVERVILGEILREQSSLYSTAHQPEYALSLGAPEGSYNSQNYSDGLLWRDADEDYSDPDDDTQDDSYSAIQGQEV